MVSKKAVLQLAKAFDERAAALRNGGGDRVLANAQADIWDEAASDLRSLTVTVPAGDEEA